VAPAAYVSLAANEAEKAANIQLVENRAVGRFGRMFISAPRARSRRPALPRSKRLEQLTGRDS